MKSTISATLVAFACALVASCYPYPEVPPHTQAGPRGPQPPTTTSSPDQQKIKEEREKLAAEEKKRKEAEEKKATAGNTTKPTTPAGTGSGTTTTPPKPPTPKPRVEWPFATPVPGREGLVFSPYNQKIVDVSGLPSGTLVTDPTFSPDEKKLFRVP